MPALQTGRRRLRCSHPVRWTGEGQSHTLLHCVIDVSRQKRLLAEECKDVTAYELAPSLEVQLTPDEMTQKVGSLTDDQFAAYVRKFGENVTEQQLTSGQLEVLAKRASDIVAATCSLNPSLIRDLKPVIKEFGCVYKYRKERKNVWVLMSSEWRPFSLDSPQQKLELRTVSLWATQRGRTQTEKIWRLV